MVGAVAQYGRGLVQPVSAQLVTSFSGCLRESIVTKQPPVTTPARPVPGLRLTFAALLAWLRGRIGRRHPSANDPQGGSR
jgi:hypothetical protein